MRVLDTTDDMHAFCVQAKREGKRLGLVPTMGALHEGHLSLVRAARARCDIVTVSIFVNPIQFGPNEDFSKYPRDLNRDRGLLEKEGVHVLFAPSREEMYPQGSVTFVNVERLSEKLCGRSRPGHFRGVTTVVSKLLHIAEPEVAFFGQKDAAQAIIIRRMVRDLNLDVQIVVVPIVRERDGLAMSSRNSYLNPQQRKSATVLYRALSRIQTVADQGEHVVAKLIAMGKHVIAEEPEVRLEYLEIVNPENLEAIDDIRSGALVAMAAYIGGTRLIDNVLLIGTGQARGPRLQD